MTWKPACKTFAWVAAATAALMACGGAGSSSGSGSREATGEPYVIGFNGGLTGSVSADPISRLDGMKAYFSWLGKNGGVNGHPVKIEARDDTGLDTAKATANFVEFRDNLKVPIIAGLTVSNVADAIAPMADSAQIPLFIGTGDLTTLTHPYAYLTDTLFSQEAQAEVNYLKTLLKPGDKPRIAVFAATSAAGRELDAEIRKDIAAAGWELVLDEPISVPAPPDMVPQANRVVQSRADYVMGGIFLSLPISFMRQLVQQNWKGKVVNYRGGSGINYLQQVANPSYLVTRSYAYPTDGSAKTMVDNVRAIGGDPNGDSVGGGWMAAALIAKALGQCGFPCSGANMKKALDTMGLMDNPQGSAQGRVGFTATDHIAIHFDRVYQWDGSKPVPIGAPIPITNSVQTPRG
jgi:ABC-type branched-subunit amino acid transport system substrate-binding protein